MNRSVVTLTVALALLAAACGAGSEATATTRAHEANAVAAAPTTVPLSAGSRDDGFPATVVGDNGGVVVAHRPQAIVSLSPTATEMLFAIGAGSQVVAADSLSDYPAAAPTTALSAFEPNVEAISEYEPDLVVLSFDPGEVVASLESLGVPTLVLSAAASISASYEQMRQLGIATGNSQRAATTIAQMQDDIAAIAASVGDREPPVSYYHELDDTYYSAASSTFIGEVYGVLGMESIADGAADQNFGYPQLSAEFILEADPDLILLADTKCCGQDAEAVARRPGWEGLTAVETGAVVELDDDVASRWGPRIVELLTIVSEALADLERTR